MSPAEQPRTEVLYLNSSTQDGVLSRGAGWHPLRSAGHGASLRTAAKDLVPGEVVRVCYQTPSRTPTFYLATRQGPLRLPGALAADRRLGTMKTRDWLKVQGGDWFQVWEKAPSYVVLRGLVGAQRNRRRFLETAVLLAQGGVRQGIRHSPRTRLALDVAWSWIQHRASARQVQQVADHLAGSSVGELAVYHVLAAIFDDRQSSSVYTHLDLAATDTEDMMNPLAFLDGTDYTEFREKRLISLYGVKRSLAHLFRSRITFHDFCLALAALTLTNKVRAP